MVVTLPKKTRIAPPTWVEIDLDAIKNNFREIRRLAFQNHSELLSRDYSRRRRSQAMEILAVLKSDAYGHGMREVGLLLDKSGVEFFGVSDAKEGICLREAGVQRPILLFENAFESDVEFVVEYNLTPSIYAKDFAEALNRYAIDFKKKIPVHIKIDTGMGRFGIWHKQAFEFVKDISRLQGLILEGLYTHFSAADTDQNFTNEQIEQFQSLILKLDQAGIVIPLIHAANSMGLIDYKTQIFNLARPGLMIFGLYPNRDIVGKVHLKPALEVKSKIIFWKNINKGRSVSYGRTFIAKQPMKVATIPLGYNDGYLRSLSNQACVLVQGERCPIVGRVTMEQTMVDISKIPNPYVGMPVTVIGTQGDESVTVDEIASFAKTINYEIICSLGNRLPRVFKNSS